MSKSSIDIKGNSLIPTVNVFIRVVNKKGKVIQKISKHNKATRNMTEGIIRFLRGEFNTTFLNEFRDSINNIGDNSQIARWYIPTHIGIGNIGINTTTGKIPDNINKFDSLYEPSYSDTSLIQEIIPKYNQHRVRIQKSVKNDTIYSNTYFLSVQGYYQFNQKVNTFTSTINRTEDESLLIDGSAFKFVYANNGNEVKEFVEDDTSYITITELGLFSGDIDNSDSRLLARLLLSPITPLIISENDTLIINWTIGVQSSDDMILSHTNYQYQRSESNTSASSMSDEVIIDNSDTDDNNDD